MITAEPVRPLYSVANQKGGNQRSKRWKAPRLHDSKTFVSRLRQWHIDAGHSPISSDEDACTHWSQGMSPLTPAEDEMRNTEPVWLAERHEAIWTAIRSISHHSLSQISDSQMSDRLSEKSNFHSAEQAPITDRTEASSCLERSGRPASSEMKFSSDPQQLRIETPTTEPETSADALRSIELHSSDGRDTTDYNLSHQLLPTRLLSSPRNGTDVPILQLLICWCCRLQDAHYDELSMESDLSRWRHQAIQSHAWNTFGETRTDSWKEVVDLERMRDDQSHLLWVNPAEFAQEEFEADSFTSMVTAGPAEYNGITAKLGAQNQMIAEQLSRQDEKCLSCNRQALLPIFVCQSPDLCAAYSNIKKRQPQMPPPASPTLPNFDARMRAATHRDVQWRLASNAALDSTILEAERSAAADLAFGGHSSVNSSLSCESPPAYEFKRRDFRRRGANPWRVATRFHRYPLVESSPLQSLSPSPSPLHPINSPIFRGRRNKRRSANRRGHPFDLQPGGTYSPRHPYGHSFPSSSIRNFPYRSTRQANVNGFRLDIS